MRDGLVSCWLSLPKSANAHFEELKGNIVVKSEAARHQSAGPPALQPAADRKLASLKLCLAAFPVTLASACRLPSGYRPVFGRARVSVA